MTVIKLGRNTYRLYNTRFAISVLVYVKNGTPIVKRVDGFRGNTKVAWSNLAIAHMQDYLKDNAQAWEIQGEILGSMV